MKSHDKSSEAPSDCGKENYRVVFKENGKEDPGNYPTLSLINLCSWEDYGADPSTRCVETNEHKEILETANMGKSCLTKLETFYKRLNVLVGKRKAMSIIYLALDRITHNSIAFKLDKN